MGAMRGWEKGGKTPGLLRGRDRHNDKYLGESGRCPFKGGRGERKAVEVNAHYSPVP